MPCGISFAEGVPFVGSPALYAPWPGMLVDTKSGWACHLSQVHSCVLQVTYSGGSELFVFKMLFPGRDWRKNSYV